MSIIRVGDKCTGCTACMQICPKHCITMQKNAEGFVSPKVDEISCVECGLCEKHCHALQQKEEKSVAKAYYGWHREEKIRACSSSGGAYSAIAQVILNRGGVVFGAVYDEKRKKVCHTGSEQADFTKQRKSKYVESDLENTFSEAKAFLESGREVLFSGTPCQIAGLYAFLGKEYSNLYTCDFICHGVAPMPILNEHLAMLERKYHSRVAQVDFRPKIQGWSTYMLRVLFRNCRSYVSYYPWDNYFKGFMKENLFLRKSCYRCQYGERHQADIVLGDFWGYRAVKPKIQNDEKGISLIMINSEQGDRLLADSSAMLDLHSLEVCYTDYAFKKVDSYEKYRENRSQFFESYSKIGFEKTAKKFYMPYPYFVYRLLYWLKRMLVKCRGGK